MAVGDAGVLMTVGELIALLLKFDPKLPVRTISDTPYPSDVYDVELNDGYVEIASRCEFED
jgi:hypothetical protein